MAKRYVVTGPSASGSGPNTALNIIGGTTVRPMLYDLSVGNIQTPADQAWQLAVGRTTAVGTTAGSPPTPLPLDPNDVAAIATIGWTHSAEPTYNAVFFLDVGVNQRATFRWVATPGAELMGSATASNGIGVKNNASTAALIIRATTHWIE